MKVLPAAAAFVVASSFALVPTAASADTYSKYDKWKDVLQIDASEDPGPHFYSPAPDRVLGDITQTRIDHRTNVVHVAVYFRKIVRAGEYNVFRVEFHTPYLERIFSLTATPGHWAGVHRFIGRFGEVPCSKLTWTLEYSHNRLVVDVPRSCLGSPTWVRVGSDASFSVDDIHYIDDALSSKSEYTTDALSPRIYR